MDAYVNQLIDDAVDNLLADSHPELVKLNWLGFHNNNNNQHRNASSSSTSSSIQRKKQTKQFTNHLSYRKLTRDEVLSNRKRDILINNHCLICNYTFANNIVWSNHKDTKKHKKARKTLLDSLATKVKKSSKLKSI
eukprot:355836_1